MSRYMRVHLACDANNTSVMDSILDSLRAHDLNWYFVDEWWHRMDDQTWVLRADGPIHDKWEFADEFKNVSAEFPDIHFEIYVADYDSDDMIFHFMHGKMQVCHMEDEFDPKKLR